MLLLAPPQLCSWSRQQACSSSSSAQLHAQQRPGAARRSAGFPSSANRLVACRASEPLPEDAGDTYADLADPARFPLPPPPKDSEAPERAYLVGTYVKGKAQSAGMYGPEESLEELAFLAESAGLQVVGKTLQGLQERNANTYVGPGRLGSLRTEVALARAETIIFDDELTGRQLRNLAKHFGDAARLCDRTSLILDIFSQRAATREGQLQVQVARVEYQLPRLVRMWTHLERQGGGSGRASKGMGETQLEVDRRLLRARLTHLLAQLEEVRKHRGQYRHRRKEAQLPVVCLVGYTNAGKSTLMNQLTNADVMAQNVLFATLDPTTRKLVLPSGKLALLSDTVGFISKLPTQLVAAFRATLEEVRDAAVLVHVVDAAHPSAPGQSAAVAEVLDELDVASIPMLTVWNKADAIPPTRLAALQHVAASNPATLIASARTGQGIPELAAAIEGVLADTMAPFQGLLPYSAGDLLHRAHNEGVVEQTSNTEQGTLVSAKLPKELHSRLREYALDAADFQRQLEASWQGV